MVKEYRCKVLYRIPISIDLLDEIIELGRLFQKKEENLNWIMKNEDISEDLQYSWTVDYNREWHGNIQNLSGKIRKKINLEDEKNIFTFDYDKKELVVLDFLKSEYEKMLDKNNYLINLIYE